MTAENAQTAMLKARRFAGILSSESSGVMAVMRQNSRWALTGMASYGYGEPGDSRTQVALTPSAKPVGGGEVEGGGGG